MEAYVKRTSSISSTKDVDQVDNDSSQSGSEQAIPDFLEFLNSKTPSFGLMKDKHTTLKQHKKFLQHEKLLNKLQEQNPFLDLLEMKKVCEFSCSDFAERISEMKKSVMVYHYMCLVRMVSQYATLIDFYRQCKAEIVKLEKAQEGSLTRDQLESRDLVASIEFVMDPQLSKRVVQFISEMQQLEVSKAHLVRQKQEEQ